MVVEIAAVCLLAKLKRFSLSLLFRTWTFYPILLTQVVSLVCQASIFAGATSFGPWIPYVEPATILSFVFALFAFDLYRPALWGAGGIAAGTVLNRLVIAQNGGHMPVYPTLSYLTGYARPEQFGVMDTLHVLGNEGVKLPFLTDWVDLGYCILSVGDVLIHLYTCVMLYALIKALNLRYGAVEPHTPKRSVLQ